MATEPKGALAPSAVCGVRPILDELIHFLAQVPPTARGFSWGMNRGAALDNDHFVKLHYIQDGQVGLRWAEGLAPQIVPD